MNAAHMVFLVFAAMAGAATVVTGPLLRRTSGSVRLQLVGLITATALVVGNAVCVLPGTPAWYSTVVIVATAAGLSWLVTTMVGALGLAKRQGAEGSPVIRGTVVPPAPARPLATVHRLTDARTRAASGPKVVTARDLHDVGPEGSRVASSSTVYVARDLDTYVPLSPIARRNRALRGQRRDPVEAMRRLRVAQAYNHTPVREGRVRHVL